MEYISNQTRELYHLMRKELKTPPCTYQRIRNLKLRDLDLTSAEINWFLNTVEWNYGVELQDNDIRLDTTFEDFFQQLLNNSLGQSSVFDDNYQMAM